MADPKQQETYAKIGTGCGAAIMAVSGLAFLVTLILTLASEGRIRFEESAPALVGAVCCGAIGLLGTVGGLGLLIRSRRQRASQGPPTGADPYSVGS